MTNITKAAQDALEAMERYQVKRQDFERFADEITALRAALQDKAGEVTVAIDSLYNERRDGMTNAIFPPVQIGTRLSAAQPAPVLPDRDVLTVNLLRHTSLTKTQARALIAHWLDGVVPDAALFKKAGTVLPDGFALVPVEANDAILCPFRCCPDDQLFLAWRASIRIAAAQQKGGQHG